MAIHDHYDSMIYIFIIVPVYIYRVGYECIIEQAYTQYTTHSSLKIHPFMNNYYLYIHACLYMPTMNQ